ncbi:MAG: hypothetical protein JSV51_08425 [Candidatus Bathyarchaeota archaeon]|nr:MAG: hypothetical protein JSV51_08425 [Candidatus Bathyarchaeota archaeon]
MSERQSEENFLALAKKKEEKFNWLGSAEIFTKALNPAVEQNELLKAGEIEERTGYCFYRAAFQAKTQEEFIERMKLAKEALKRASVQFEKINEQARSNQSKALAMGVDYWITPRLAEERARLINDNVKLWKKVASSYKNVKNWLGYGKSLNELIQCFLDRFEIERDWPTRSEILEKGLDYGEKAIANFSKLGDDQGLARAYYLTCCLYINAAHYGELMKRKALCEKSLAYQEKANEFSEKVGDGYLIALSNLAAIDNTFWLQGDLPGSLEKAEKALQQSLRVKDNLLIGQALIWLASITYWTQWTEEDPDKKRETYKKTLEYATVAASHLNIVSPYTFVSQTHWSYVESLALMAREVETSRKEKRALLGKAIKAGRSAMKSVLQSGQPESIAYLSKSLSKALYFLSSIEPESSKKKLLLDEALKFARENLRISEESFPYWYWYRGVGQNYQALILSELASIEADDDQKRAVLEEAVQNMEGCRKLCTEWTKYYPQTELFAALGRYCDSYGIILSKLYNLTNETRNLEKIAEVYQEAVEAYSKAELTNRLAESYWQIAKAKDELGEYLEAAENFESASKRYKALAEKTSHLKEFYMDYAFYMQAWSAIERARYHHTIQEWDQAKKQYETAASLHKSSNSWKHLAPNYMAWAQMEQGEDLSRDEQSQEAIQAFQKATKLFREAKKTLQDQLDRIENTDEKNLANRLIKASYARGEYCLGRIDLEEAKILDKQGNHAESSKKYENAAEKFQEALDGMERETDRRTLRPIVYLCRAWHMMTRAEAEASPDLYLEASQLFDEAKKHSFNEKAIILAMAHSNFCRALEAGTRFESSRDRTLHIAATQHLESAVDYYVKAGLKEASEYAKGTQRLFNAYIYMDKANEEVDLNKKAKYYMMAEKILEASAGSYMKAKYPAKSKQVQRLLKKVKDEKMLAMSLSEIMHVPSITSTTASFVTPTPGEEMAVGLERFERAEVQVKLVEHKEIVKIGENFDLKIQIANVGKEDILVARIEEILPAGFEPVAIPDYCFFEDKILNLKGKQLDPLKTEELRLVLRPLNKGNFELRPKIVCVDKTGHQIFCQPEPVTISVSEVVLPNRVTTGYSDLDTMLFGGIPENYAVILSSASCDEKDLLIKRFLEAGVKKGQITFYITIETAKINSLVEEFQSNFYLFLCNPQAETMIKSLPNVFKLKGVDQLTEIDIALTRGFREIDQKSNGPRRACIEIISDVLLQHHAATTRRWLARLIPLFRSKGFTTLAIIDPQMHPPQESKAILGLFEGEIDIYEKETKKGLERFIKIRKMFNQEYLESETPMRKERLQK